MALRSPEIVRQNIIVRIHTEENLLALPRSMVEILKRFEKSEVSAEWICKIVDYDPILSSSILKLIRVAFSQRFSKAATVQQAVSVLGIDSVVCLALWSSVYRPETIPKEAGLEATSFLSYTLSVAIACERIAKELLISSTKEAFTIGILNEIGLLFFLHYYPEQFRKALHKKAECKTLVEAERMIFGIDHYEISSLLVQRWKLPKPIADAVGFQGVNNFSGIPKVSQAILCLATQMTTNHYSGFECAIEGRCGEINRMADILGLTRDKLNHVANELTKCAIEIFEYFGSAAGRIEEHLIEANQEIWRAYQTIEQITKDRRELNQQFLKQKHESGALESKNSIMATLFHYVNNSSMVIYGRAQMMRANHKTGKKVMILENLERDLDIIESSIQKIVAVLEEVQEITTAGHAKLSGAHGAVNLDVKLAKRMSKMSRDQKWFSDATTQKIPV